MPDRVTDHDETGEPPKGDRPVFRVPDIVSGALIGLCGVYILIEAATYPPRPMDAYGSGFFPRLIAISMLAVGALLILTRLRAGLPAPSAIAPAWRLRPLLSAGLLIALSIFSVFAIQPLGFVPTGIIVAFIFMLERRGRPLSSVAWSAGAVIAIYSLFTRVFSVTLPVGVMPMALS